MQPWRIATGLIASLAGTAVLLAGERLDYLAPFWPMILADHGPLIGVRTALALATVTAAIYIAARAAGLADLGRRVDLAERSARRGEGDPELTDALRRDTDGEWE